MRVGACSDYAGRGPLFFIIRDSDPEVAHGVFVFHISVICIPVAVELRHITLVRPFVPYGR